jgi:hypothetical protein
MGQQTFQRVAEADSWYPRTDNNQSEVKLPGYLVSKQDISFFRDRDMRRLFRCYQITQFVDDQLSDNCTQAGISTRREEVKEDTRLHFVQGAECRSPAAAYEDETRYDAQDFLSAGRIIGLTTQEPTGGFLIHTYDTLTRGPVLLNGNDSCDGPDGREAE